MVSLMRFSHSILVICLITCTVSCTGSRIIKFPSKVDTRDKPIVLQQKQVEFVTDIGVYVSNDFPSARLNNVSVKNDSTLVLRIQPENEPINNSAYFAFMIWASNEREVYFECSYPKGYKHRYVPKYKTANNRG